MFFIYIKKDLMNNLEEFMKITCHECGKSYEIDESKIQGTSTQATCKVCGQLIRIKKPVESAPYNPDEISGSDTSFFEAPESETDDSFFAAPKETEQGSSSNGANSINDKPDIPGISIRSKITFTISLLVLISISFVGTYTIIKSRNALSASVESQLNIIAMQKATEYSLIFERIQKEAISVAEYAGMTYARTDISNDISTKMLMPWNGTSYKLENATSNTSREIKNLQRITLMLKAITPNNSNLSLGYMGTENGITVFSDESIVDVIKEKNAYVVYKREWYMQAKKAGKAIWTKPYIDANSGELVVTCAAPVYRPDGPIVGVIGFDVLLKTIQNDILKLSIGYGSYAFMIDKAGKALVHPGMTQKDMTQKDARWDETYTNDDLSKTVNPKFNRIITNMMMAKTGMETYKSEAGEKYIAYAPLKGIDSSLGIVVSKALVIKPAMDLQWQILMIVVVVLVIAICIGMFLGNSIVTPLNRLTVVANLISQGKMELEVMNEERKDEIGVLTKSINRLVISLKLAMDK